MKPIIGIRDLLDDSKRKVNLDDDDRQYVIGEDDEPVHGNWVLATELEELTPAIIFGSEPRV